MEETMTVNLERIPKKLWKKFGIQALKEDKDKRELFIKVVQDYVDKTEEDKNV